MADIDFIQPDNLPALGAYTQVIAATGGKTIYVAGQVSVNAVGQLVGEGDLGAQTRQVCENIQTALAAAGATFADLVKLTMYIVNYQPEHRDVIMNVRKQYVSAKNPPTSTLLGIQSLALPELLIEMDAIAVVD